MTKQEFLAMSLPTGLIGITQNRIVIINGINYEKQLPVIWDSINKEKSSFSGVCGFGIMPILHPLSDLTKPIEHKGEKFVPSVKLNETITGHTWNYFAINTENVLLMNFEIVLNLIEWHFDLADLISKGEAIDINTLEANPYK